MSVIVGDRVDNDGHGYFPHVMSRKDRSIQFGMLWLVDKRGCDRVLQTAMADVVSVPSLKCFVVALPAAAIL